MAMMRFDHFDVVTFVEHLGCHLQQFESEGDPHAHIGRKHNSDVARRFCDLRFLLRVKTSRAYDHFRTLLTTQIEMCHGRLGAGKINQHPPLAQCRSDVVSNFHAARRTE